MKNLAAALMRLEKSHDPEEMLEAMSALIDWLQAPTRRRLRRAFTVWIKRVLLPARLPNVTLPKFGDLLEVRTMLAERVIEWTQQWKAEGRQEGWQTGMQTGLQTGLQTGMQTGMRNGEARILQKQLERRFGPLPDWALTRLNESTEAELEGWCVRVLDQPSLQEILN